MQTSLPLVPLGTSLQSHLSTTSIPTWISTNNPILLHDPQSSNETISNTEYPLFTSLSELPRLQYQMPDIQYPSELFLQTQSFRNLYNTIFESTFEVSITKPRRLKYKVCRQSGIECCICLEKIKKRRWVSDLGCCHKFHSKCLNRWVRIKRSCPLCRCRIE